MIATLAPTDDEIQREFKEILPELASRLRYRFCTHGPEVQAEFVAEAVALSWQTFVSASRRGRTLTASTLAWYAVKAVFSGRRLAGSTSLDALSDRPLARQRIGAHVSLSEVGEDAQRFYHVFGDRR